MNRQKKKRYFSRHHLLKDYGQMTENWITIGLVYIFLIHN